MRWTVAVLLVVVCTGVAAAETRERGFIDLYGGAVRLWESDVPDWKFEDLTPSVGARAGIWLGDHWALTLRTWYYQTDAKQEVTSPSDLAFLGISLELLARWRLDERWAVYGTLGPMLAITTLDLQSPGTRTEDDARSLAPGASGSVGIEVSVWRGLRGFAEAQLSIVYPQFTFQDRSITPRLVNTNGLVGVRVPF
jgi:hypothetical protein